MDQETLYMNKCIPKRDEQKSMEATSKSENLIKRKTCTCHQLRGYIDESSLKNSAKNLSSSHQYEEITNWRCTTQMLIYLKTSLNRTKKRTKKRNRIELIQYEGQQYLYVIRFRQPWHKVKINNLKGKLWKNKKILLIK